MFFLDELDVLQLHRVRQQRQAGGFVLHQRALEKRHVETHDVHGHVGQGVNGHEVEGHVGVAQGQVQIQQAHVMVLVRGHGTAQVHRNAGCSGAASGSQHGHYLGVGFGHAVGGDAFACSLFVLQALHGLQQFFEHHRGRQEFVSASSERLQNQLAVALGADRQDAQLRAFYR